jgi:hypothetical protein
MGSERKVQTADIHPGGNHGLQYFQIIASGANGGNDFSFLHNILL